MMATSKVVLHCHPSVVTSADGVAGVAGVSGDSGHPVQVGHVGHPGQAGNAGVDQRDATHVTQQTAILLIVEPADGIHFSPTVKKTGTVNYRLVKGEGSIG